jgi:hypothetical protein
MTLKEVPTSGTMCDKVYYEHPDDCREYRFVVRFMMTEDEAVKFLEEMVTRGASRVRAEAKGSICFIETPVKFATER